MGLREFRTSGRSSYIKIAGADGMELAITQRTECFVLSGCSRDFASWSQIVSTCVLVCENVVWISKGAAQHYLWPHLYHYMSPPSFRTVVKAIAESPFFIFIESFKSEPRHRSDFHEGTPKYNIYTCKYNTYIYTGKKKIPAHFLCRFERETHRFRNWYANATYPSGECLVPRKLHCTVYTVRLRKGMICVSTRDPIR